MKNFYTILFFAALLFPVYTASAVLPETVKKLKVDNLTGSISGTTAVCVNASQPVITFLGGGGTAPYTFTYTVNSGTIQNITTTTGNTVTVNAPTNVAGTFTYSLTEVKDSTGAVQTVSDVVNITIVSDFTVNAGTDIIVCKGNPISLAAALSAGSPANVDFSWTGPNNYTSANQTLTIPISTAAMSGNYTITASKGNCQRQDIVHVTVIDPQISSSNLQEYEGTQWLVKCTNPGATSGNIFVMNGLPTSLQNLVSSYTIDWGDSSPNFTTTFADWNSGGSVLHTYSVGLHNLDITINTTLGCTISRTYKVFVGNQPASPQIQLPVNAQGCVPFELTFPISGVSNNIPGTTYTITFSNDPTHPLTYDQSTIPTSVNRIFQTSSCNSTFTNGNNVENNAFGVSIRAVNPCGSASSSAGPIRTSTPPTAAFNLPETGCVNQTISIINQTINGSIVTSTSCNTDGNKYWEISPGTGWTLITSNLGNNGGFPDDFEGWLNGSQNLNVKFTIPGNYTIKLYARNSCSVTSTISKNICIEPALQPTFTKSATDGCSPLALTTTNTTNLANQCGTPTYSWSVQYVNSLPGCGTNGTPVWNFITGNATSPSPSFNFVTPGTYKIKVTMHNGCGAATSAEQDVIVRGKPLATINTIPSVCGSTTTSITPTVNFTNCGTQAPVYAWSSTGGAIISDPAAVSPTISYTSPGTYTVTVTVTNECGATTDTETFTISPPVIANAGNDITICGGANTVLNGQASGGTGSGYTYVWAPATGLSSVTSATPTATPTTTTTYTLTVRNTATGCTATDQVTVTVNTLSAGAIVANQTICNGGDPATLTETTAASGTGTLSYQWEMSTTGPATGYTDIAGATSATYDPPGPITQRTWYRRKVISTIGSDTCTRTGNAVEININNVTAGSITGSQVICIGGDPTLFTSVAGTGTGTLTYQWQSSTDNVTFSNITGATNATYDAPALAQTTYYKRITKSTLNSVACTAESNVIAVTVKPDPVVDTQPQSTQTVCQNGNAASLTVAVSGGEGTLSYQWYSNATASITGAVAVSGATQATYTPLTNIAGTKYYYVVVSQSGLGCQVTSSFAEVIVTQSPQITTQPTGSAVCQGGTVTPLTVAFSNGTGTPSYQWYSNSSNNNTSGTAIPGATASSYSPLSNTVGTNYYYAEITFGGGGGCAAIKSATAAVTVSDFPAVTVQPIAQQEICVGGSIPALTFTHTGGAGTASYKWYTNTTATNIGGVIISGATSQSYTPPVYTTAGIYYYYAEVMFSGNSCGTATTAVATVTVVPDPVIGTQPIATQTWCENATPQNLEVTVTGGSGTLQYQWYSNTANNTTGGTLITGATSATYTPLTIAVGTKYYYCVITTPASGCSVTSGVSQVIVNPAPTFTTQPQGSTVCVDGIPTLLSVAYANGTGTPAYQWYESATPANSGGNFIATATSPNYQPEATTAGTRHYYCVITFSSVGCNSITSQVATVTVNPDPTISTEPLAQQEICVGGNIAPLNVSYTDGFGTASYQWYSHTTAANSGGTAIGGATSSTFTPTTNTTPGTYYYYALVTLSGSGCGSVASNVAVVTVVADPIVTSTAFTQQILCEGATVQTLTVTASGGSGTTYNYQWYVNNANNNAGGTAITGETNSSYTPPSTLPGTKYYYCEVSNPVSGCLVKSSVAQVVIMPAPAFTAQPQPGTVCQGQTPAALTVAYNNGTGTASYQWFRNTTNDNSSGTAITGANSATYQPPGATVGTVYYYAQITFSSGGCQVITSSAAAVTIDPLPAVTTPQSDTICSGSAFNISPVDGSGNYTPAGTTYTWSAPAGSGFTGGSAQASPQSSITQILVNTTTAPVTATYTVTPRFNSCVGNAFTVTITVNPTAVIADVARTICSDGSFTVDPSTLPAASIPAGTTYSWNTPVVTGGLTGGTAGAGQTIITGSLTNPTTATQTATYTVTPLSPTGNCTGDSFDIVVTVKPQLQVTQVLSNYGGFEVSAAGGNDGSVDLTPTGGSGTYTYSWTGPNGFTSIQQDVSGLIAGTYTVTISDGLCDPIVLNILIREPLPLVIQEALASHVNVNCFGQTTGVVEVQVTQASIAPFDYIISVQGGAAVETVMNLNALNYVFDNLPAGTYEVKVVDANGTVKTIPGIIVTQPASGLAISNATVSSHNGFSITCNGANNGSIDLTVAGGYPVYTYSWTGPNGFMASTQDISNLAPGSYSVVIGDTTGVCTITQTYTITEPQPLTYTGIMSDYNGFGISCSGGSNGTITITPAGGTGTYSYQWSGPNGFSATTQNLTGVFAGTYMLTVTDSNGCVNSTGNYTLTEPASMAITETHTNLLCFGASTGSITTSVSGGVPGTSGYAYSWSGPNGFTAATQNLNNVMAGTYTLTVTDNSGCTKTTVVTLTQPTEITITATTTPISCYGANDATITLGISGGVGPYQAAWDNFASGTYQENLAAGTYGITVTDGNNCTKVINVVIPEAPIFTVNPVHRNISCHGANDGSIVLNFVGGQAPITLVWSDGSTSGTSRHNLPPGTYTVTITDSKPCVITRTFVITEPNPLNVAGNVTHALDCNNTMSGAINLLVSGGMPPFTYAWSNGATTEDLANITSGTYSVTVTDANGCTNFRQFTVTRPQPLQVSVTNDISFNCDTDFVRQVNTATASGGVLPYQYTWSAGTVSGANGQIMSTNNNGMVTVTVTDGMGCTAAHTFEIDTQHLGDASYGVASYAYSTYGLYSIIDPIQFTNTSTGDYVSVAWDFGDGVVSTENDPVHMYQREGNYTVTQTVTYPYGCVERNTFLLVIEKGYDIMIPTGFTPNGDGTNDLYNAQHRGLKRIEMSIYDTWGSLIYSEQGETLHGWDGTLKGRPAENGNYVYKFTATTFYGHTLDFTAPFTLLK